MSIWILCTVMALFPGMGVAASFGRLNRESTAIEVICCALFTSLLFYSLFSGLLFAFDSWDRNIFFLGMLIFSCLTFLFFKGTHFFRSCCRSPKSVFCVVPIFLFSVLTWGPPSEWITYYELDAGRYSNIASFMLRSGGIKADFPLETMGNALTASDLSFPKYFYNDPSMEEWKFPYLHLYPSLIAAFRDQERSYAGWKSLSVSIPDFFRRAAQRHQT